MRLMFDWSADNTTSSERKLYKKDQDDFFERAREVTVLGISEFQYTHGGKLQNPELEREIWFRIPTKRILLSCTYIMMHFGKSSSSVC